MQAIVLYYSRTGTTKKVAESIASAVGGGLAEIVDLKKRGGIFGFLSAGYSARAKKLTEIRVPDIDLSKYDTIIVGTPIWAGEITPAVRTYLSRLKSGGLAAQKRFAFFLTCSMSGDQKRALSSLEQLVGEKPIAWLLVPRKEVESGAFEGKVRQFVESLTK